MLVFKEENCFSFYFLRNLKVTRNYCFEIISCDDLNDEFYWGDVYY